MLTVVEISRVYKIAKASGVNGGGSFARKSAVWGLQIRGMIRGGGTERYCGAPITQAIYTTG
jgi:hypothetical protein